MPLGRAESIAGIALVAALADGVVNPAELAQLGSTLSRMRLFKDLSAVELENAFNRALKVRRLGGPDALLREAAQAVPQELRPTAFAIACDLALADGTFGDEERTQLEKIRRNLGLPENEAADILKVMVLKNGI